MEKLQIISEISTENLISQLSIFFKGNPKSIEAGVKSWCKSDNEIITLINNLILELGKLDQINIKEEIERNIKK